MKILHITAMEPLSPNSGIPAVLKQLTDAQNAIPSVDSFVLSLKAEVNEIGSPYFFSLGENSVRAFLNNYTPDVAILHSFFHVEYIGAVRALIKAGIQFYIEPHGSFGRQAMKKSTLKKRIANATVFRQQIKESIGYIFTNKAELKDAIYRTNNDLVIPNGVCPNIIRSSKMKTEDSFSYPTLYFLGRFDVHHKGLDYLFDSLDILENEKQSIKINIYGTGNDKQVKYVNDRIKNYSYIKATNCGTIYGEKKKRALESCNILILTSRYEGVPMTVLDGLSYGNPCIVTPGTNVSDEVSENLIGWHSELSPNIIAETIIKATNEYKINGKKYYTRCKEYVLNHYSWEKIAEDSISKLSRKV